MIAGIVLLFYRSTPLEIKRLEVTQASMYVAKLSEGLSGKSSIRCCGRQEHFLNLLHSAIDDLNSIHFMSFSALQWMTIRAKFISYILYVIVGILLIQLRQNIQPATALVVLAECRTLIEYFQSILELTSKLQKGMNAVERLNHYSLNLESEGERRKLGFNIDNAWPQHGSISIVGVNMRYRPNLPLTLRNFNLEIEGGLKVGVVGRTGAGKSSMLSMLLRLVEISDGTIIIDGVNITTDVGIEDLRSQIAVIPQDPTLFIGTIRSNLDPFGVKDDQTLYDAMRSASLISSDSSNSFINSTTKFMQQRPALSLDTVVEPGGSNFSHGERQLMALARAIVKDSRIIISDEATSNVDYMTDLKIQKTIQKFEGKTVISIAHRIRTVLHYDRICVLDNGRVVEYDKPLTLFHKPDGIFRSMCDKSDLTENDFRLEI
jgi:ABC-type multidrug transport system fused ATPase/permease subunit